MKDGHHLTGQVQMWPTPNVPNGGRSVQHVTDWRGKTAYHHGKKVQVGLEAAAKMWPTPEASPGGPDYARACRPKSGGDDLSTAVARTMWRTPSAIEGSGGPHKGKRHRSDATVHLTDQVGGQLNPTWVEWLMGFPLGWTAFERSAMPSSRGWRTGSRAGSEKPATRAAARHRSEREGR